MLPRFEELGAVYRDGDEAGDFIHIVMSKGMNSFRIRLFVNATGRNAVLQDLHYVIDLAKRVQAAGATLLLDFHYSDTWADPAHQKKPEAWSDLSFDELESQVYDYTRDVLAEMKKEGCLPEMVQLGNEISNGMLWPEGRLWTSPDSWDRFIVLLGAGLRAVREFGDTAPEILIHYDNGCDTEGAQCFFSALRDGGLGFDHVGLSYYPWWHGDLKNLEHTLGRLAMEFGKPVHVVETAYPWRGWTVGGPGPWPAPPDGHSEYLAALSSGLQPPPRGLRRGSLWRHPEPPPPQGP
ncbi:glycosyl hydrolase 53 family protein, partial [bacterium]|nr:glycosyl hydrolase 53 family protein [bacterium]